MVCLCVCDSHLPSHICVSLSVVSLCLSTILRYAYDDSKPPPSQHKPLALRLAADIAKGMAYLHGRKVGIITNTGYIYPSSSYLPRAEGGKRDQLAPVYLVVCRMCTTPCVCVGGGWVKNAREWKLR